MSTSIFDSLCGESGVVNQINEAQDEIREVVTTGKNAISQIKRFANDIENLQDAIENNPGVVTRRLQEDLFNILTQEALANPTGTIAKLLEIRAAYQGAGPALDRIIENVEQFIRDPLNTPLNLCEDIPNIVRLGDSVKELAQPSVVPDGPPEPADKELFTKEIGLSDFEIIPRFPTRSISEAVEAAGRFTGGQPGPGDANAAAIGQ
jgi:ABC-type transporter Mla subunit MlaD